MKTTHAATRSSKTDTYLGIVPDPVLPQKIEAKYVEKEAESS
jgi:hypothetical protein